MLSFRTGVRYIPGMGERELYFGKDSWGRRVEAVLIHHDIWPAFAWRVEWGSGSGARSGREVFSGLEMEQEVRARLASKMAELGTDWARVER